jgi:hypothetical protein
MLKWCWKFPRTRKREVAALGLFWLVAPLVGTAAADVEAEPPPGNVSLDRLLTLPSALPIESSQHGGLTRGEWSRRFVEAEAGVEAAKAELDESLDKLSELVGTTSNWKVAAPGVKAGPSDNSPVNYGLKQEIQRKREDVARAERKIRELIVEANLAGVPEDWYKKREPSE